MKSLFRFAFIFIISASIAISYYSLFNNFFDAPSLKNSSLETLSPRNALKELTNPPTPTLPNIDPKTAEPERIPDAPYLQTPPEVLLKMLELAKVQPNDLVYDLGSGDGRIAIAAVQQFGAKAIGIEIDPELIRESSRSLESALKTTPEIGDRLKFIKQDLFKTNLRPATAIMIYLSSEANLRIYSEILPKLKSGTRIVSHEFGLGSLAANQTEKIKIGDRDYQIYLWVMD
jgi:SAM-dependent methyltransferase